MKNPSHFKRNKFHIGSIQKSRILFSISFLIIQLNFCTAQNTADTNSHKPFHREKIQLGIFFSPDYCNQVYKPVIYENSNFLNTDDRQIADTLNSITNSGIGYSTGINIECPFNKRLSLKTGVIIAVRAKRYNGFIYYNGLYYEHPVFYLTKNKREQSLFLEFPVALNYTFAPESNHKMHMSCFAGGVLSINCNNYKIETTRWWDATQPLPATENGFAPYNRKSFSILYTGILAGAKLDYRISDCLGFNIAPTFKYSPLAFWNLKKGDGESGTIEIPYSIGCALGISYYVN